MSLFVCSTSSLRFSLRFLLLELRRRLLRFSLPSFCSGLFEVFVFSSLACASSGRLLRELRRRWLLLRRRLSLLRRLLLRLCAAFFSSCSFSASSSALLNNDLKNLPIAANNPPSDFLAEGVVCSAFGAA